MLVAYGHDAEKLHIDRDKLPYLPFFFFGFPELTGLTQK